jgi:hypothetical protein
MPKCLRVSSLVGFARLMLKLNKGSVRRLQFTDAGASLETGGGVITSNIGEGKQNESHFIDSYTSGFARLSHS